MSKPVDDLNKTMAKLDLGGRYTDIELLGEGGVGQVFRAKDNNLDKPVAIKLLKSNVDVKAIVRFQQEARVLSKLNHPYIVKILDFHYLETRDLFLVMDHVEGDSLQSKVEKQGRLPAREAIKICIQLCEGLDHAHGNAVVHRDLTPRNVIVDSSNNVRILDFGIAKLLADSDMFGTLTRADGFIGSPLYMSPEQMQGGEVDARCDIYSLGMLLFFMMTGHVPFEDEGILELLQKRLTMPPPSVAAHIDDKGLAGELDEIIQKCLQADPDDRFPNMIQLRDLLAELIAENPDRFQQSIASTETIAVTPRKPRPLAVAASLALIAFSGWLIWQVSVPSGTVSRPVVDAGKNSDPYGIPPQWGLKSDTFGKKHGALPPGFSTATMESESLSFLVADPELTGEQIVERLKGRKVEYLSLADNKKITDDDIELLRPLNLKGLNLGNTLLGDSAAPHLAKLEALEFLSFDGQKITESGMSILKPLSNLRYLYLDGCNGIGNGAVHLIIQNFPGLEVLHLGGTSVTGSGLKEISRLKNLRRLWLSELRLKDEDLLALEGLNLTGLDLTSLPISGATLLRLKKMDNLRYLELSGCHELKQADIDRIKRPQLTIIQSNVNETFKKIPESEDLFRMPETIEDSP